MNVKERLMEFVEHLKITASEFQMSIGVSTGYIGSIRKSIGIDILEQISNVYPQLNLEWLMTGKGSMIKSDQKSVASDDFVSALFSERKSHDEHLSVLIASNAKLVDCNMVLTDTNAKLSNVVLERADESKKTSAPEGTAIFAIASGQS